MKKVKPYDGLALFESDAFGGIKVYDQISPTIRSEKVQTVVLIVGSLYDTDGENGRRETSEKGL